MPANRRQKKSKNVSDKSALVRACFTRSEARNVGMSRSTIPRLVKHGVITKIDRGLYALAGAELHGEAADFAIACKKFGNSSSIGGLSALFHYQLTDEVPSQIWVLVPPHVRTISKKYRLLRTKRDLLSYMELRQHYKIVSLERALIDALVYSSKIGERLVKVAFIRALRRKATNARKLFVVAESLGALALLESEWQGILAGVGQ